MDSSPDDEEQWLAYGALLADPFTNPPANVFGPPADE